MSHAPHAHPHAYPHLHVRISKSIAATARGNLLVRVFLEGESSFGRFALQDDNNIMNGVVRSTDCDGMLCECENANYEGWDGMGWDGYLPPTSRGGGNASFTGTVGMCHS